MSAYLLLKNLHLCFALTSLCGLLLRTWWSLRGSALLEHRWTRLLPRIIDTGLILSAVSLAVMLGLSPHNQPWLLGKLLLLALYIGLGVIALRGAAPRAVRCTAGIGAVLVFGKIGHLAVTKAALF